MENRLQLVNESVYNIYNKLMSIVKYDPEQDILYVLSKKYNVKETYYNHDLVIVKLNNEYIQAKNKDLIPIISHLSRYNEEKKLEWEYYLEEEELKKQNPTPKEIEERYRSDIILKQYADIRKKIGYDDYDTYKEVINEVNQHDEYSDEQRLFELAKQSSQKISSIFLSEIKEKLPKEYYHFKALADKISPN